MLRNIQEGIDRRLTVERAARLVGLSRNSLYELFLKRTGLSPSDHILRRRCKRVMELLLSTDGSIAAIAFSCGFSPGQR
jgi:transcriptional regulator GlxA family with amidase domain